jgi:GR25 family glycosyltransferase involved in LPS biosynthesis
MWCCGKAVDEQLDYIAIFEDDIYLGKQAVSFLTNVVDTIFLRHH